MSDCLDLVCIATLLLAFDPAFDHGGANATHCKALIMSTEFPERPGALRKFLLRMQTKWNISLFHYRNHGAGTHNSISVHLGTPLFC